MHDKMVISGGRTCSGRERSTISIIWKTEKRNGMPIHPRRHMHRVMKLPPLLFIRAPSEDQPPPWLLIILRTKLRASVSPYDRPPSLFMRPHCPYPRVPNVNADAYLVVILTSPSLPLHTSARKHLKQRILHHNCQSAVFHFFLNPMKSR